MNSKSEEPLLCPIRHRRIREHLATGRLILRCVPSKASASNNQEFRTTREEWGWTLDELVSSIYCTVLPNIDEGHFREHVLGNFSVSVVAMASGSLHGGFPLRTGNGSPQPLSQDAVHDLHDKRASVELAGHGTDDSQVAEEKEGPLTANQNETFQIEVGANRCNCDFGAVRVDDAPPEIQQLDSTYEALKQRLPRVVGGATFEYYPEPQFIYLNFLGVAPLEQVSGIGLSLMIFVKAWCKVTGVSEIVTHADIRALGFFKKSGFKRAPPRTYKHYASFLPTYVDSSLMIYEAGA